MSGVATKLLRRSRSVSFSSPSLTSPISGVSPESRIKSMSMRSLHCSILHPRAPKIRHLNASHNLLIDLDKHIARVQELEYKVSELEARIAEREALKHVQINNSDTTATPLPKPTEALVSEEDRLAFQNRLNEAKKRAEELSRKTNIEEANILRSWHSKRLKQVLDTLSSSYNNMEAAEDAPKLLAAPSSDEVLEENRIFDALNALVGLANDEAKVQQEESDRHIMHLKNLIIERENLKLMMEGVKQKFERAAATATECQVSLQNLLASASALRLQLKASQSYLFKSMLKKDINVGGTTNRGGSHHHALWIYGPNPIFTGVARIEEISASVQNTALEQALRKTEISQMVAEKNLHFAQELVAKYSSKMKTGTMRLNLVESEIEKQIHQVNSVEDTLVDNVCMRNRHLFTMDMSGAAEVDKNVFAPELPNRMND